MVKENAIKSSILKQEEKLILLDLNIVQRYFEMQDVNKWLTFNVITKEQAENANRFGKYLERIINKLYVPNY